MKKGILGAAVLLGLAAGGAAWAVDFDRGADIGEVSAQARALRVNTEAAYYREACQTITLGAGDNAAAKDLVSVQYADKTEEISYDQGGPVVSVVPYETGRFTTRVSVTRYASGMYPWEKESFRVCALAGEVTFKTIAAANKYKSVAALTPLDGNSQSAAYELRAVGKLPMGPDPEGIKAETFSAGPGGVFSFTASDKWAAHYAGEKTRFTARVLELIYPDAQAGDQSVVWRRQVAQAQLELSAASGYRLDFLLGQVPAGSGYEVSLSFSRIGAISTPEEVEAAVFPL